MGMTEDKVFVKQCDELAGRVTEILFSYPKAVGLCVLPGLMAAVAGTFKIPRDTLVAMLDSALEDIQGGPGS